MIAAGQFAVRSYLTLMLAFLYLPIAIMIAMAFNQSALYELPFHFSFVWFEALSGNTQLWAATRNSVTPVAMVMKRSGRPEAGWVASRNSVPAGTVRARPIGQSEKPSAISAP